MKSALFPVLILLFLSAGGYYLLQLSREETKPAPPPVAAVPSPEELAKQAADLRVRAEKGDPEAQFRLGALYDEGIGVKADEKEAIRWWRKAGDEGYADAEFNLGNLYADGAGVATDYAEAAKWFRMAADRNMRAAQFQLALLYAHGDGVKKDPVEAAFWLTLALRGTFSVSPIVRDQIMGAISEQQKDSVRRRAESWKPLSVPASK